MFRLIIKKSIVIVAVSFAFGSIVNFLRPLGIDFIAKEKYDIFVPCPEPVKDVDSLKFETFKKYHDQSLIIDARDKKKYKKDGFKNALNIEFDYLYPVKDSIVEKIADSGVKMIFVYGDNKKPDSGEQLARELAGRGIKNIKFVKGGINKIRKFKNKL